jgi:hypothetical protein
VLKLNLPIAVLLSFALATSALAAPITTFNYTYTGSQPTPNATYPDTGGVELNNNAAVTAPTRTRSGSGLVLSPTRQASLVRFG